MTISQHTGPQAYPLWCAAMHDRESGIRVGLVVAWDDSRPVVAWQSDLGDTRTVSPPDAGEMWWVDVSASTAWWNAEQAASKFCGDGHGVMTHVEPGWWRCQHDGCLHSFVTGNRQQPAVTS